MTRPSRASRSINVPPWFNSGAAPHKNRRRLCQGEVNYSSRKSSLNGRISAPVGSKRVIGPSIVSKPRLNSAKQRSMIKYRFRGVDFELRISLIPDLVASTCNLASKLAAAIVRYATRWTLLNVHSVIQFLVSDIRGR